VAETTAGTIDGARRLIIPDAGHMPFSEAPARFSAAAEAFPSNGDPETRL
jgi:pimeloyl-ACP methyl ester carboxylesterase